MKVAVALEDEKGVDSNVCAHFGQCRFFLIADIDKDNKKVTNSQVVPNTSVHSGGGCVAVGEILKCKITDIIAAGMGVGAQQKFANAGVKIYGYSGKARDALADFMNGVLGGIDACKDHGSSSCH